MPCSNCMVNYTAFKKEHGCSKCGFGFCEKCVSKKAVIPGLSTKPMSVCDSCYAQLTGQQFVPGPNLNKPVDRSEPGKKSKNWWGDDDLPPPSMRRDYMNKNQTKKNTNNSGNGGGGGSKIKDDLDEFHQRLAKLQDRPVDEIKNPRILITSKDENGQAPTGSKVLDAFKNDSVSNENKDSGKITISEIEERLAALRGLPVEVIRKPRLLVCDEDEDSDEPLPDEAIQLLQEAETQQKGKKRKEPIGYDNQAIQIDDNDSAIDKRNSEASLDSTTFRKIMKECEDTPSVSSSVNSSQIFPNFADQVRKVREEALEAEKQAALYIQESEGQIPPPTNVKPFEGQRPEGNTSPKTPKANSPNTKKTGGFFSKFFKNSKDA